MKNLLVIMVLLSCTAAAQTNKYYFSTGGAPYTELTGATELTMPWTDTTDNYAFIDMGNENFKFFSQLYPLSSSNKLGVSTLGNLKVSNAATTIIIDGYFTWLAPGANTKVRYKIEGSPGSRIVKIEYKDISFEKCDRNSYYVNFQIWLYQQSGNIEMYYGSASFCDSSHRGAPGPYVGLFRSTKDFTAMYNIFWLTGNASSPTTVSNGLPTITGDPANGMVYRITTSPAGISDLVLTRDPVGTVYPNPAARSITYDWPEGSLPETAMIFDHTGRIVAALKPNRANTVDIRSLPAGLYLMRVQSHNQVRTYRFSKTAQ